MLDNPVYRSNPKHALRRISRVFQRKHSQWVSLPWNTKLFVNPREMIGNSIWRTGVFELGMTEALWRLTPQRGVCIDVGANIGYATNLMAKKAGIGGSIYAFEPHPTVYPFLKRNANWLLKNLPHAEIFTFNVALSSKTRQGYLLESDIVSGNHFQQNWGVGHVSEKGKIAINLETFDSLIEDRIIDVMKVDVEGHEADVFQGAKNALTAKRIQNIVFEDHIGSESPVCHLLITHGYALYRVDASKPEGIQLISLDKKSTSLSSWHDTHNFVAMLDPKRTLKLFMQPGWQCLTHG